VGLAGRHLYGVVLPCYSTYQPWDTAKMVPAPRTPCCNVFSSSGE
jgi:hypothetical protein